MVRKYEGGPFAPAVGFPTRAIQLDPSGVFLVATKDRVMKIFKVDGEEIASLELFHSARLLSWAGPHRVICGSDEGYVYVVDLVDARAKVFLFRSQQRSLSGLESLEIVGGHTVLAIAGPFTVDVFAQDPTDHSWKLGHEIKEFPNDSDPTPIASVHLVERDGTILMHAVYLNQGVRIWNISPAPRKISEQPFIQDSNCKQACIAPDGNTLAIFDGSDGFDLFSTQTKQKLLHISMAGSARSPSPPMAFVHAGLMLVAGNSDGELRLWDVESGIRLQRLQHDGEMILSLTSALSLGQTPLGDRFIIATVTQTGDFESKIWIWRGVEVGE